MTPAEHQRVSTPLTRTAAEAGVGQVRSRAALGEFYLLYGRDIHRRVHQAPVHGVFVVLPLFIKVDSLKGHETHQFKRG